MRQLRSAYSTLRVGCFALVASAFAAPAFAVTMDGNAIPGTDLTPPTGAPAPDATGRAQIVKTPNAQMFFVGGKHLPADAPPSPYQVWLESAPASHQFAFLGSMSFKVENDVGVWILGFVKEGGGAPEGLGVADVLDLAGRGVQVRDAAGAAIYLQGVLPSAAPPPPPPPPPGGDDGPPSDGPPKDKNQEGGIDLLRPDPAPDADAYGKVQYCIKGPEQQFQVHAGKLSLDAPAAYAVYLEAAEGAGEFFLVGGMIQKAASSPFWDLVLVGSGAPPAALQISAIGDLAGRVIQVRDSAGVVVLLTKLPSKSDEPGGGSGAPGGDAGVKSAPVVPPAGDEGSAAQGIVVLKSAPKGLSMKFDLRVAKVAGASSLNLFVESAVGSNVFVDAGGLDVKGKKLLAGRYIRQSKKGDSLPLGVLNLSQLSGRKIQIRNGAGAVKLAAVVP